jgi:RNA polymerase II-associated protein 3
LPYYQLNLAAAHLKLSQYVFLHDGFTLPYSCAILTQSWMEAEEACTRALSQHRSSKGYYRRARARKMLGQTEDAIEGA